MSASITCFANIKGGVGKTTLTINVAHTLAEELQQRVLVVDMDPQINATTALLPYAETEKIRRECGSVYGFFSKVDNLRAMDPNLLQPRPVKAVPTGKGFDLILGSLDTAFLELRLPGEVPGLNINGLKNGLQTGGFLDQYDHILIDTPPTPSFYLVASLKAASHFAIPTRFDHLSIQGAGLLGRVYQTLRDHRDYAITAKPLGVILTLMQNDAQTTQGREILEEIRNRADHGDDFFHLFEGSLPLCAAIGRAQIEHRLIRELPPRGPVKKAQTELLRITSELSRRLRGSAPVTA
jgi:chromosome partitioning protein